MRERDIQANGLSELRNVEVITTDTEQSEPYKAEIKNREGKFTKKKAKKSKAVKRAAKLARRVNRRKA